MKTAKLKLAALRMAFATGACVLAVPASAHYKFLATESDAYRVELIRWERYGERYSKVRFGLLVTEKSTGEKRQVEIDNLLTGIERLEIADGTLLASGDVEGHFQGVTLVQLTTAEVTDFILSYGFHVSPSRKYVVFRRFYPPRGMAATQSDVVMIYDLTRGRSVNWLQGSPGSPAGMNVGVPVYPPENVHPPTYRVWVPEETQRHYVDPAAGFLWSADEKSLFFIDRTGGRIIDETGGQTLLVHVSLEEGLSQPRIGIKPLDVTPVIAVEPQSPEYPKALAQAQSGLAVIGLELESDGRITLKLDPDLYRRKVYRVTELTVSPPEAAPQVQPTVGEAPR